jgi:pimeloyl-ACP methyl ester carboxylesterase
MKSSSLRELQHRLQTFSDPLERRIAEESLFLAATELPQRKHIVVLLHGMNTNAEWQEAMAEAIRNSSHIEPLVVGYGNFNPVKFFIPYVFRRGRIAKVVTDLRSIRKRNPEADISIVAHSFGTYIVSKVLSACSDMKFHRILLCGAIVNTDYDWDAVSGQFKDPVINDIGRKDIWPSMAKSWSWDFGDSGCIGFQNSLVRDRHFTFGHSDFLNEKHMRKYWLPYLLDGRVVPSRYTSLRKTMGMQERMLRAFSWRYLILLAVALWAICRWVVPLALSALAKFTSIVSGSWHAMW